MLVNNAKVLGFILLSMLGVFPVVWTRTNVDRTSTTATNGSSSAEDDAQMRVERQEILGVDVLMAYPHDPVPKGILFVGHGCSHSNTDFFAPTADDTCPECIGLPEELAIVEMAVHKFDLAVVAISSQNRDSKCWAHGDGERVAKVLGNVYAKFEKEANSGGTGPRIPVLAFGASSGGGFVGSALVESMEDTEAKQLDGYISQIAAPEPRAHKTTDQHKLPVAVYITMNRDERTDASAKEIVNSMKAGKHSATHIRLDPLPVTESFFHDRILNITFEQSTAMVEALHQANFLDPTSKQLVEDPRRSAWRDVIRPLVPASDSLKPDESPISEVMNVARGAHEMTRDGVEEAIKHILQKVEEQNKVS